ncbi:MAG: nicotinamide-nucleotide amidohydrolase family protein [Porticoccus sp.]|nr:nicotinamide-nucleotide amidohydrolase family protein [Porticoccus sp.]
MNSHIKDLSTQLGELLLSRQFTVTCAESCTGGGIASAITDIAGSSQWFHAGFVTYANDAKEQLLRVSPETLVSEGAVSGAVVRQMAEGALMATGADIVVAVSGVAGPDGGTEDKPVGMVWFAWAIKNGVVTTLCVQFKGDRAAVRQAAVEQALMGLIEMLKN